MNEESLYHLSFYEYNADVLKVKVFKITSCIVFLVQIPETNLMRRRTNAFFYCQRN